MSYEHTANDLIDVNTALNLLLSQAPIPHKAQSTTLDNALGKVLAKDITSHINVPNFDNSAMDGYAIYLTNNKNSNKQFTITDRITTGSLGVKLKPDTCARIFTGAPIPEGANVVVMQEDCSLSKNASKITVNKPIKIHEHIRLKGSDIQQNDVIVKKGKRLKPQDIAFIASVGVANLQVFKTIKVGVFFTGDELLEPGQPLENGKIYSSNRYALVALLKNLGCEVVNLGNIKDKLNATCDALTTLQTQSDLIITTGGVSVGEEDHIKPALKKLGKLSLWNIKIKPGKPLAFGTVGQTPFIGLPGNPVSAIVTFMLFARPFIKKMQGNNQSQSNNFTIQTNFNWQQAKNRREFVRVKLNHSTSPPSATLYPKQSSEILSSIVWADGLVEIPENITFTQGKILNFYSLNELIL